MAEADNSRARTALHLEDLRVGQRFVSGTYALGEGEIQAFAREFDPQPFHLDDARARDSLFAGLAASGWHTAAVTMRLLVDGGPPLAGGIIGAGGEIAWPQPTRPGDVLHVETEILEVTPSRSRADRGMVTMRTETLNQRRETVQLLTAKVIATRRAVAQTSAPPEGGNDVTCEKPMKRYQTSVPRAACAVTAVVLTAITFGVSVVMPAQASAESCDAAALTASKAVAPVPASVGAPGRVS